MRATQNFALLGIAGLLAGALCAGALTTADTPPASKSQSKSHKKAAAKKPPLPPLPSGPQGPVPQIALDTMQAVAPHVTYQGGQLTIVAPNSTLADILRAVRKLTGAEMDIPAAASERVVTNLGPGPAPGVVAELLNGSHFNYVLLASPSDANTLTHVVLVLKSGPETAASPAGIAVATNGSPANVTPLGPVAQIAPDTPDSESADDSADDNTDQNAAEAEQPPTQPAPGDGAVKTPQQLLQEMQQRQLQMQQQQQQGQPGGQPPLPGGPYQQRQLQPPPQPPDQQ